MKKTIIEKILERKTNKKLTAGEIVLVDVDLVMMHDSLGPIVIESLHDMGFTKVFDPKKVVAVIDHLSPSPTEIYSNMHKTLREFTNKENIRLFEVGNGICHQLLPEKGMIRPGEIIIGTDSHTCTYGALNAFATGVGSTDAAAAIATGKLWFRVPETIKINITGTLPNGVYSKDIILNIIGNLTMNGATYKAVEFSGKLINQLSVEARLTISNMAIEMGAKAGLMVIDDIATKWLKERTSKDIIPIFPDDDAIYSNQYEFDVTKMEPQISAPHSVDNVKNISELEGIPIHQGVLGTCTNGRLEDLRIASSILKGNIIPKNVRLIVVPSSRKVLLDAIKEGILEELIRAGCTILSPGCGPCVGAHGGIPADGENVISSSNRNFKGRMGNNKANIYLSSPAVVAASTLEGKITNPQKYLEEK